MSFSRKKENKNILVVDDEYEVLDFLKTYLESMKWDVVTAISSGDAFNTLAKKTFFLIITDIAMPDIDGYEFIKKIKDLNITSRIILMTGFGYDPNHSLIKINKMNKYPVLFKPFEFENHKLNDTIYNEWKNYNPSDTAAVE